MKNSKLYFQNVAQLMPDSLSKPMIVYDKMAPEDIAKVAQMSSCLIGVSQIKTVE